MLPELDQEPRHQPVTYEGVFAIAEARIDSLKAAGLIRYPTEIQDEWEQDNHFADLADIYAHTCRVYGLAWPPVQVE